jgi:hypothetical protein
MPAVHGDHRDAHLAIVEPSSTLGRVTTALTHPATILRAFLLGGIADYW